MNKEIWTIGRILRWTEQYFHDKGLDSSRLDGEVLLSHVLGVNRVYLFTHYDQPLAPDELDSYRPLVIRRAQGYSVASIVGHKEFMDLDFAVSEDVLIPRPDTETLIMAVLDAFPGESTPLRVLDMCTGPGTILLSLLHYRPQASGIGLDISDKALALAAKNAESFGLADRAQFLHSDLYASLPPGESFDLLVSNPPYIRRSDLAGLSVEVKNEPQIALDGGEDGLDFYRAILMGAKAHLNPGAFVAVEIGQGQEEDVMALGRQAFGELDEEHCGTVKDLGGIIRLCWWKLKLQD